MAINAQQIYDRAIRRSLLSSSVAFSLDDTLASMSFYEAQAFMRANQVNPDFFGTEATTSARTSPTNNWLLLSEFGDVGIITRIEVAEVTGQVTDAAVGTVCTPIHVAEPGAGLVPRVYIRNMRLYGYGTDLGPDTQNFVTKLKVWYSRRPAQILDAQSTISLPDEWAHLIITPVAAEFAMADQRLEEYAALMQEYSRDLDVYTQYVRSWNYRSVQPYGNRMLSGN